MPSGRRHVTTGRGAAGSAARPPNPNQGRGALPEIEATLYAKMLAEAKARGARKLYVSAASNLGAHVAIEGMTQPRAAPSHSALNGLG